MSLPLTVNICGLGTRTTAQALSVAVAVAASQGGATPTGSVTLAGGGYTSTATALTNGSATINIPAGGLAKGTDSLVATYTPDSAVGPGTDVTYSVDAGRSFDTPENLKVQEPGGRVRAATAVDYTHIRWQLKNALKGNSVAFVRFRAQVK